MPAFLIPLFVVIFITIFSTGGGNIFKGVGDSFSHIRPYFFATKAPDEKGQKQAPAPSIIQKAPAPAPLSFILDTAIEAGPAERENIAGTKVTFGFSGSMTPRDAKETITFESKVQGVDADWVASSNTRTLNLPPGPKEYTLLARAKTGNIVDLTPASRTFSVNVSPYFQKIRISSVRSTQDKEPALIILSVNFSDETPVNITGWKLKSQWRGETIFGKGIEKFQSVLTAEALDNILVRRSDTLYVRGEQSPFGRGRSFKSNQCFGYLIQYYPNLPGSYFCSQDRPGLQDIRTLNPLCQEYILRKVDYSSCKPPDFNDLTVIQDSECRAYLTGTEGTFTYQGCYEKRSKDANFLSNRWDIYIEQSFGHPLHDTITLLDQTGLIVDTYIY